MPVECYIIDAIEQKLSDQIGCIEYNFCDILIGLLWPLVDPDKGKNDIQHDIREVVSCIINTSYWKNINEEGEEEDWSPDFKKEKIKEALKNIVIALRERGIECNDKIKKLMGGMICLQLESYLKLNMHTF